MTMVSGDSASRSPAHRGWTAFGLAVFVWARLLPLPVEASRDPQSRSGPRISFVSPARLGLGPQPFFRRDRASGVGLIGACLDLSAYGLVILSL